MAMAERRGTVLLVEDKESIRVMTERMLDLAGYDTILCASAEEALDAISRLAGPVDVLLSDVYLGGMNGPTLATEMRRHRPRMGVVLMSGYTEAEALDTGMTPGTRFLNKPYSRDDLIAAIEAAQWQERGQA